MSVTDKMVEKEERATELHHKWLENGSLSPEEEEELSVLCLEITEYYEDYGRFGFWP